MNINQTLNAVFDKLEAINQLYVNQNDKQEEVLFLMNENARNAWLLINDYLQRR